MVYEAFHLKRFNIVMAALCALLSILGFCVNGVIPTASTRDHGASPLVGWIMVAVCFAVAAIFLRRAFDSRPLVRIDRNGLWARSWSDATVPWDQIVSARRDGVSASAALASNSLESAPISPDKARSPSRIQSPSEPAPISSRTSRSASFGSARDAST